MIKTLPLLAFFVLASFINISGQNSPTDRLNKELSSRKFYSNNEIVFDFVNYPGPKNGDILTWLEGKVKGLRIERNGFDKTVSLREENVIFYVDEFKVDNRYLQNIDINDIAMVKVISPPFQGRFAGGTIAIYLRDEKKSNQNMLNSGENTPVSAMKNGQEDGKK